MRVRVEFWYPGVTPVFLYPSPLSKHLSTSSSLSRSALVRWNSDQMAPNALGDKLRTSHCEHVRKMLFSGLDPSMLIGFLRKTEEDWIDLRRWVAEVRRLVVAP